MALASHLLAAGDRARERRALGRTGIAVIALGFGGATIGINPTVTEAQAQAICMQTEDFRRAYEAFVAKAKPVFAGD